MRRAGVFCPFLFLIYRRCTAISKELLINEAIRDKEVRVIGPDGEQLGIMSGADAKRLALEKDLDLVKIAPQGKPPVCKIMDYGKYKFELAKREKEAKKNQRVIDIKEVRLSPSIDEHDYQTKLNNAIRFLKAGDKVKVAVRFRGREMQHTSLGQALLIRFSEAIVEYGTVERMPKLEGRSMIMFIAPKVQK